MKRLLPIVMLLQLLPSIAIAQTPCASPCTLKPQQPYSLVWDQPVLTDLTHFRIQQGPGTAPTTWTLVGTEIPVSEVVAGTVTRALTSPATEGTISLRVQAVNKGVPPTTTEAVANSTSIVLISKLTVPPAPGNLRIIVAISSANGSIRMNILGFDTGEGTPVIPFPTAQ